MGQRIQLDKEDQAVLLFSKARQKWEDKTSAITAIYSAYYYQKFTGYDIYFKGSDGKFFYKKENVQLLEKTGNIDIEKMDVYVDGEIVNAHTVHQFEQGFYRVYIGRRSLFTGNLRLESNKHKDILKYYSKLAEYAGLISEENSPLFFLSINYKRITPAADSVLFDYLKGACNPISDEGTMALPFDFNQSQVSAIESALKNKISIIEGPPGTGKTQTILNLIASIIYRGMNCAVVSNNNTAIDNVYEKLDEEKLSFIAATLGRASRVAEFFESEQNAGIPNFLEEEGRELKRNDSLRIKFLSNEMKKIQAAEVETAILESQHIDIQNESRHYENVPDDSLIIKKSLSSTDYLAFITRLETPKKIRFFERWRLRRKFRVNIVKEDVHNLLNNVETLYYQTKISELTRKIESGKKFIERHNKEHVGKELKAFYRIFLENSIRNHYRKYGFKEFTKASYKYDFEKFLKRYPVVLSTSQSLLNNAPKGFTFDYLIIDEASQGDLLSNLLAMSCAKNLVIVGDSRQLQQIDDERLFPESKKLSLEYNVPKAYQYESNSILTSVKDAVPDAPTTLLREHYRCAPDIINFCNKMYYDGALVPMTKNSGRHIEVIKSAPGNHARSNPYGSGLYNQREIDEIEQVLISSKSNSIGIISPFRYHANIISNKYSTNRIEADTIHKFQGRQKEEIILSFVVNSLEKAPDAIENRLYDFVTNAKLLNVAISRGRDKVTVIAADKVYYSSNNAIKDFIRYAEYLYGSDITKESAISSVFDILYSEYTDALLSKFKERPKGHFTELLMSEIIKEVLNDFNYIGFSMHTRLGKLVTVPDTFSEEERRYIQHPWTHVDFLFFNKISKEKLFVLEVDGIKYHEQDKKQHEHDIIKDRILQSNNIPIHRFRTNESNEKQRLREIMYGFSY